MSRKICCLFLMLSVLASSLVVARADGPATENDAGRYAAAVETLAAAGVSTGSSAERAACP